MDGKKISDLLKDGYIIRTKHLDNSDWVTNVIYAVDDDCIEFDIGFDKSYINNLIMVGDSMKCKYGTVLHEYMLEGEVSKIKEDFPQSITVKVKNISKFSNNRKSIRYDVYLCSVVKVKGYEDCKGIFAIMVNVSAAGAAFVLHEEIEKTLGIEERPLDEVIAIFEIYVSPKSQIIFEGKIKRKNKSGKGIEYGVLIANIDGKNKKALNELISTFENKDKDLYDSSKSYWKRNSKLSKNDGGV